MALRLAVLKSVFNSYNEYAFPLIVLFIALIFLVIKDKKEQRNLLIYEIFGILLLVMPFVGNKIVTLGAGNEANWPVYGVLCAIPVTAYVMVQALQNVGNKKERIVLFMVLLLALQMGFGLSLTGEQFVLPGENPKISQTAVEIAKEIDAAKEPYVMAPTEIAGDLREYSGEIRVFYNESYGELQKDLTLLQNEAAYYGCNYIVIRAEYDNEAAMTAGGYGERVCVADYVIYEKNSK